MHAMSSSPRICDSFARLEEVTGNARRANLYCTKCPLFDRQQAPIVAPQYQYHSRYKWCVRLICAGTDCNNTWYVCIVCNKLQNRYKDERGLQYHNSKFHAVEKREQHSNRKRKLESNDDNDHNSADLTDKENESDAATEQSSSSNAVDPNACLPYVTTSNYYICDE